MSPEEIRAHVDRIFAQEAGHLAMHGCSTDGSVDFNDLPTELTDKIIEVLNNSPEQIQALKDAIVKNVIERTDPERN